MSGRDREAEVVEDLLAAAGVEHGDVLEAGEADLLGTRVGEADMVEGDVESALGQLLGLLRLPDEGHEVEDLEDALEADDGAHDVEPGVREHRQRRVEAGEQEGEGDDLTGVEVAEDRLGAADAVDERESERRDEGEEATNVDWSIATLTPMSRT